MSYIFIIFVICICLSIATMILLYTRLGGTKKEEKEEKEERQTFPAHYISLDKNKERTEDMEHMLSRKKITATRVSAVDGRKLDKGYIKTLLKNKKITPPEVGCILSHQKALNLVTEPVHLIMESDCILRASTSKLNQIAGSLKKTFGVKVPYVCLLYRHMSPLFPSVKLDVSKQFVVLPMGSYYTMALFVNPAGAKVIVDNMFPIIKAYDNYLSKLSKDGKLLVFGIQMNNIVKGSKRKSTIQK